MKLLITGVCGFAGSSIAEALLSADPSLDIIGLDNFIRPGSPTKINELRAVGVRVIHGDIRAASDLENIPEADWVIDAAANPSVLAGIDGRSSSRQLLEHNLIGTLNLLEYCRRHDAGFILLSTSRVYSIAPLSELALTVAEKRFLVREDAPLPPGLSRAGIGENFSTRAPVSLYGATKIASEVIACEYAETLGLPVWINRCGVMAGAGQFGRADQGIVAYWINTFLRGEPLRYIGFGGRGEQVRDVIHPRDVAVLIRQQLAERNPGQRPRIVNLGGGQANSFSLAELTEWCATRFGSNRVITADSTPRPLDLPWVVMNSNLARASWNWTVNTPLTNIFEEVAVHAESHPDWLSTSAPF